MVVSIRGRPFSRVMPAIPLAQMPSCKPSREMPHRMVPTDFLPSPRASLKRVHAPRRQESLSRSGFTIRGHIGDEKLTGPIHTLAFV